MMKYLFLTLINILIISLLSYLFFFSSISIIFKSINIIILLIYSSLIILFLFYFFKKKNILNNIFINLNQNKKIYENIVFPKKKQIFKMFFTILIFCIVCFFLLWLIDFFILYIIKKIL